MIDLRNGNVFLLLCGCLCSESLSNTIIQCDDTSSSAFNVLIGVLSNFVFVKLRK